MIAVEDLENRLSGVKARRAELLKEVRRHVTARDKSKPGSEEHIAAQLAIEATSALYNEAHHEVWRLNTTIELLTRHKPIDAPPSSRGPVRQV
jgi:hypothetical protein